MVNKYLAEGRNKQTLWYSRVPMLPLLFLCTCSDVTNSGSLDPTGAEVHEINLAMSSGVHGDRVAGISSILVFVQEDMALEDHQLYTAAAWILRQVDRLPDTKRGKFEKRVTRYLRDNKADILCK